MTRAEPSTPKTTPESIARDDVRWVIEFGSDLLTTDSKIGEAYVIHLVSKQRLALLELTLDAYERMDDISRPDKASLHMIRTLQSLLSMAGEKAGVHPHGEHDRDQLAKYFSTELKGIVNWDGKDDQCKLNLQLVNLMTTVWMSMENGCRIDSIGEELYKHCEREINPRQKCANLIIISCIHMLPLLLGKAQSKPLRRDLSPSPSRYKQFALPQPSATAPTPPGSESSEGSEQGVPSAVLITDPSRTYPVQYDFMIP
jgi:hypothetical protein